MAFARWIGRVAGGLQARRGFPCAIAHDPGGAIYSVCNAPPCIHGDIHAGAHGDAHSTHNDAGRDIHSHP